MYPLCDFVVKSFLFLIKLKEPHMENQIVIISVTDNIPVFSDGGNYCDQYNTREKKDFIRKLSSEVLNHPSHP